jgi:hypothetical protein
VFKTVNKYKNITNNNSKKPNSLNFKIKKILKKNNNKSDRPTLFFFQHVTVKTHIFFFFFFFFFLPDWNLFNISSNVSFDYLSIYIHV